MPVSVPQAYKSPLTLASLQLQRDSMAEFQEAEFPWREAALEGLRRRNAVLDAFFYDVGTVMPEETSAIAPWLAREGVILIVPPTGAGPLQLCQDLDHFAEYDGADIRAVAVAGVGSSALGSAAFARNVADAFGEPVAAVVSGYGLADLITEASGGWFWFGELNRMRHQFEQWDDLFRGDPAGSAAALRSDGTTGVQRLSLDVATLHALLTDRRFNFALLTGHSKGNLVISETLYAMQEKSALKSLADTWIVTVSATITMPRRFSRIVDVMGNLDWFGRLNSRRGLGVELAYPNAWHHTNTDLPFHLPVRRVFEKLKETRGVSLQ